MLIKSFDCPEFAGVRIVSIHVCEKHSSSGRKMKKRKKKNLSFFSAKKCMCLSPRMDFFKDKYGYTVLSSFWWYLLLKNINIYSLKKCFSKDQSHMSKISHEQNEKWIPFLWQLFITKVAGRIFYEVWMR